jgi:2',3'-cyclic-nucleotide 2'-phosphodiesterase (5'-nucleotidase family)
MNSEPAHETLAIVGTNDIHGALFAHKTKLHISSNKIIKSSIAGLATLSAFIKILKKEYQDRLLWLDAGDQLHGSLESNIFNGEPMVKFFNRTGLDAAAIGNHDFDFGTNWLKKRIKQSHYPWVSANIYSKKSNRPYPCKNKFNSIVINKGDIKVGIIGLTTLETFNENLYMADLKQCTESEAHHLRQKGANIIVLLAHLGMHYENKKPQGELVELLTSLSPGTIDAVVSGHTHTLVHHCIAGIPVIQGGRYGEYINIIYLTYDKNKKILINNATKIEGPIPVCTRVLSSNKRNLIPFVFHGKKIKEDASIKKLIQVYAKKISKKRQHVLARTYQDIPHFSHRESPIGNLITKAIREHTHADIVIMHGGGIRTGWHKGPITYGDLYRTLPFNDDIISLPITGCNLKKLLSILYSGKRGKGFYIAEGLKVTVCASPKKLIKVTLDNNEKINSKNYYTLALGSWLAKGGDDFILATDLLDIKKEKVHYQSRDIIQNYLTKIKKIDTDLCPLVDINNPKLIVVAHEHE